MQKEEWSKTNWLLPCLQQFVQNLWPTVKWNNRFSWWRRWWWWSARTNSNDNGNNSNSNKNGDSNGKQFYRLDFTNDWQTTVKRYKTYTFAHAHSYIGSTVSVSVKRVYEQRKCESKQKVVCSEGQTKQHYIFHFCLHIETQFSKQITVHIAIHVTEGERGEQ